MRMKIPLGAMESTLLAMRESSLLLGVAGLAENLFQGGSAWPAILGAGFLVLSVFIGAYIAGEFKK